MNNRALQSHLGVIAREGRLKRRNSLKERKNVALVVATLLALGSGCVTISRTVRQPVPLADTVELAVAAPETSDTPPRPPPDRPPSNTQALALFGDGRAAPLHEDALDRRFKKSGLVKLLRTGSNNEFCRELLGGLLVALAETLPSLHRKDLNFWLDPVLLDAVTSQLTTPNFTALTFVQFMVRQVLLDHRLPDEWLTTATALQFTGLDMAKLRSANEQLDLAESVQLTLPLVRERYLSDVLKATGANRAQAVTRFRDTYLDRAISWRSLLVLDVIEPSPRRRGGELLPLVAHLAWVAPPLRPMTVDLLGTGPAKPEPLLVVAKLAAKQFIDLDTITKGQRVLVKGRFWEMNRTGTEFEVRDAVLFSDPDWSAGVHLSDPAHVARCPEALNELTGLSPDQQGGFRH